MWKRMWNLGAVLAVVALAWAGGMAASSSSADEGKEESLELGNFSVSLAVKDIKASQAFYEKLGFKAVMGEAAQKWIILQNATATIGLFQGALPRNTLAFNPGWTRSAQPLEKFQDVRDIQRILKERGLKPTAEADEASTGPAFLMLADPDGNPIFIDQHVPRPGG